MNPTKTIKGAKSTTVTIKVDKIDKIVDYAKLLKKKKMKNF